MSLQRVLAGTAIAAAALSALLVPSAAADDTADEAIQPVNSVNSTADLTRVMTEATEGKKVTILALSSKQCGPCQQMKPKVLKAANDEAAKTWVLALHEAPTLNHTELSRLYSLRGWPTFLATGGTTADPSKTCGRYGSGDFGNWAGQSTKSSACQALLG